jgi:SAM-dependent methyltransferase
MMTPQETQDEIATLYDLAVLYDEQHRSFTEDIAMYETLARDYGGPVLELGIGNARVGLELARRGREVWGLDLSPAMLRLSAEKAAAAKVELRLHQGDMADFSLGDALAAAGHDGFGLVMVPFNSLCHLHAPEQLVACLESVRRHLKPGGVFAPSIFVPHPGFLYREAESLTFVDRFRSDSRKEEIELYETNRYDPVRQLNHLAWYFIGMDSEETLERRFTLRMYYPQELRYILRHCGFRIVEEWSEYGQRLRTPAELGRGVPADTIVQTLVCQPEAGPR